MITKYPEMLKTRHIDCLTRSWIISNFRLFFFKIIIYFGPPPKTTFLGEIAVFNKFKLRLGEHDLATLGMAWISLQRISSVHDMFFFNYKKQRKKFKIIYDQLWNTKPFIITSESVKLHWSIHCCREEFNKFLLFWYYLPCYNRTHLYTPPIQFTLECITR